MSEARKLIDELNHIAEAPVVEQMLDAGPPIDFAEQKKMVRQLLKSAGAKKLASDLAGMMKDKFPKDATIKEREFVLSDIMHMMSAEIAAIATFKLLGGKVESKKIDEMNRRSAVRAAMSLGEETELDEGIVSFLKSLFGGEKGTAIGRAIGKVDKAVGTELSKFRKDNGISRVEFKEAGGEMSFRDLLVTLGQMVADKIEPV